MRSGYLKEIIKDGLILAIGVLVAIFLIKSGFIYRFLVAVDGMQILASFLAGSLFTSVFTIAPASIALSALATKMPAVDVAFWGACGAVIVDYVIFTFVRGDVSRDLAKTLKAPVRKKIASVFHFGFMRWLIALLGGLIIASPLPDELGIALLSISRIKVHHFVVLTFVMNFLGIWLLASTVSGLL